MSASYKRKDYFYEEAKEQGYRSRAAFKLMEINKKFKLFNKNSKIFDLGAWPGGWLQVASQALSGEGLVVGIDLVEIEPFSNSKVALIKGDINHKDHIDEALKLSCGGFDIVLSDMSPKLSGIRDVDQNASQKIYNLALQVMTQTLKPGGSFVVKVFKSPQADLFFKTLKTKFTRSERVELDATRHTSNEFYLVAINYKATT
jgi:23S rRNA (uridine2552-2'-O)-methyltransferase